MKDGFENLENDILFSLLPGSQEQGSYEDDLIK